MTAEQFDAITQEQLQRIGSAKWSRYPAAIGAFVAEMDFGLAAPIRTAIDRVLDDGLLGYLPERLQTELSQACATWQQERYGWDVPPAWIRPLPDVLQGLMRTIELFTAPGSAVVLPTPAYMPFLTVPEMLGRRVVQVPMDRDEHGWHLDLDGIDQALAAEGGLLIFCNPHNPIGKVYTRAEMTAVAEIVQRHGARVFSDEIHAPLTFPGHVHVPYASVSAEATAHTVTATSASKAFNLPGLKCAQLILSNQDDATVWEQRPQAMFTEHGASTPGVVANIAAYREGAPWLADVVDYLDGNRRLLTDLVTEHLPGVVYHRPEGTYLAWLDCRALELGDHPSDFFLQNAGVAGTDGAACGEAGRGSVRFNVAMPRPIMRTALERMGTALAAR